MKTSAFQLVAPILCGACLSLAIPSSARAAFGGFKRLIDTAQLKASNANDDALSGADKQRELIIEKLEARQIQFVYEGAAAPAAEASLTSHSGGIVDAVAAVAELESKVGADGLDDAERKSLGELVGVARGRVDAAIADASTELASTKKLLAAATTDEEKAAVKLHLKSLRATVKAHRQTSAALQTLAKRLAAS